MGLLEMLSVAWVHFVLVVRIVVFIDVAILMALLIRAMLKVPGFRNSAEIPSTQTPRPEIGSSLRRRNSPATPATNSPATQIDVATIPVFDDRQVHARSRVGLEQIESFPPVIGEQPCTICECMTSPSTCIQTLECEHEFQKECMDKWLRMKSNCPNFWASIDRANRDE